MSKKSLKTIRVIKQHLAPVALKELFDYSCLSVVVELVEFGGWRRVVLSFFWWLTPSCLIQSLDPEKTPSRAILYVSSAAQIRPAVLRRSRGK